MFTNQYGELNFGKIATAGALVISLLVGGCGSQLNNWEYSEGKRTGMINKVSKKGLFWQTYEGQMALEGIVSNGQSSGANVWDFSIDSQARHGENTEDIAKKLNEAFESGKKVKISYREVAKSWPWRGETDYFVQKVEYMDEKK